MPALSTLRQQFVSETTLEQRKRAKNKKRDTFNLLGLPMVCFERIMFALAPMDRVDFSLTSKWMYSMASRYVSVTPSRFYLERGTVKMEFAEFPEWTYEARVEPQQTPCCHATQTRTVSSHTVCAKRTVTPDSVYVHRKADCLTTYWNDVPYGTVVWAHYLRRLFKNRAVDVIHLDLDQFATADDVRRWFLQMPRPDTVQISGDCREDPQKASQVLDAYGSTQNLLVKVKTTAPFAYSDRPIKSEFLSICHGEWFDRNALYSSEARYIHLTDCRQIHKEEYINNFLHVWMRGGMPNLRYLAIRRGVDEFNVTKVFRHVTTADAYINDEHEERRFPMSQFADLDAVVDKEDRIITGGIDVFRMTDDRRATLVFQMPPPRVELNFMEKFARRPQCVHQFFHLHFYVWPADATFPSDAERNIVNGHRLPAGFEREGVHQLAEFIRDPDVVLPPLIVRDQRVHGVAAPADRDAPPEYELVDVDAQNRMMRVIEAEVLHVRDNIHGIDAGDVHFRLRQL